jgi:hypothetical protein
LDPVVEQPLHQQLEVPLEVTQHQRPRRKRRRKRVRIAPHQKIWNIDLLTNSTAKEESDEDMGFGLFD